MSKKGLVLLIFCMNGFVCAMNHDQQHENRDAKKNSAEDSMYRAIEAEKKHYSQMAAFFEESCIVKKWELQRAVDEKQKEIDRIRESGDWGETVQMQEALNVFLTSHKYAEMSKKELQAKL
jgi:hypothetical protein